jgi:hypothetical protein
MNKEKRALATYNDVMVKIAASKKEDWIPNLDETERTYKGDLNIRILSEPGEKVASETVFNEPWVQGLGHDSPKRQLFTIYYGNSFVRAVQTVAVDGFRAYIPYPKSMDELVITNWAYRFAQVIQPLLDNLDSYLERAGIRVSGSGL